MIKDGLPSMQQSQQAPRHSRGMKRRTFVIVAGSVFVVFLLFILVVAVSFLSEDGRIPRSINEVITSVGTAVGIAGGVGLLLGLIKYLKRRYQHPSTPPNGAIPTSPTPASAPAQKQVASGTTPGLSASENVSTVTPSSPTSNQPVLSPASLDNDRLDLTPRASSQRPSQPLRRTRSLPTPEELGIFPDEGNGSILIWLDGQCPYSSIFIVEGCGVTSESKYDQCTNIVAYKTCTKAVFKNVPPKDYTLYLQDPETRKIRVIGHYNVESGQCVVIDKHRVAIRI